MDTRLGALSSANTSPSDGDTALDPRARDQALAEWALLLEPLLRNERSLGIAPAESSTSHSGTPHATAAHIAPRLDGDAALAAARQTSDTPVNDPGPSRLVLSLSSETLGQIELVIDRDKGGVSIVIGVDEAARGLVSPDKFALIQSLTRSGVTVNALGIVSRERIGTVLAEGKTRPEQEEPQAGRPRAVDPKRKRLSLIG